MQKMLEHWEEFFFEKVYDILRPFYKKITLQKWTWGFLRRTQHLEEICKLRGKFLQILGSSQNIWMLRKCVVKTQGNLDKNTFIRNDFTPKFCESRGSYTYHLQAGVYSLRFSKLNLHSLGHFFVVTPCWQLHLKDKIFQFKPTVLGNKRVWSGSCKNRNFRFKCGQKLALLCPGTF